MMIKMKESTSFGGCRFHNMVLVLMNSMMSRWRQRRRSLPATKLWPTKLLQLLRRSGHHQYQCCLLLHILLLLLVFILLVVTKDLAIFITIATTNTTSKISRDDCENDLAEAIPALQSAINSLNTLKPSDITEVRNIAKLRDHSIFYFPVKFKDLCIEVTKRNSGEKYEEPSAHRKICH